MGVVSTAGTGKPGYCKLCSMQDPQDQDELDKRTGLKKDDKYVYSPDRLNEWLAERGITDQKGEALRANRQTWYSHRKHVMHPKDRIVSAVQKRTLEHGVQPAQVSEDQFLDSLIKIGNSKIAADPDAVTIDQALKAVQIKKNAGTRQDGAQVLVAILTGTRETDDVIEGEVVEH